MGLTCFALRNVLLPVCVHVHAQVLVSADTWDQAQESLNQQGHPLQGLSLGLMNFKVGGELGANVAPPYLRSRGCGGQAGPTSTGLQRARRLYELSMGMHVHQGNRCGGFREDRLYMHVHVCLPACVEDWK